jgi:DNA (cytosine-5)-methyltransferase 1
VCVNAMIEQGDRRSFLYTCGELCRVLGIALSDLPQRHLDDPDFKAAAGFRADECFCWVDFDTLAAAHGFTVKHGPLEVTLKGPPVSDAKYRAWLVNRTTDGYRAARPADHGPRRTRLLEMDRGRCLTAARLRGGNMHSYYNENDQFAAAWLRNLIAAGHLPPGEVDERSIVDVRADDLRGFRQCHFFAGIGGWPYALRLAGWPEDRPVWTGSCPCQPLSSAGQRKGHADERHLWPAFHRLIAECRPAIVFGEQVASKDGREWLAGVRADLEALGYAVGAADLCAASCGAPHIRQRLFWVANADGGEPRDRHLQPCWQYGQQQQDCGADRLGHAIGAGLEERAGIAGDDGAQRTTPERTGGDAVRSDADEDMPHLRRPTSVQADGLLSTPWQDAVWLPCLDGKARRIEPGIQPLAHGVSARVGRLRGYGNAIVPQVAAEFIMACLDV